MTPLEMIAEWRKGCSCAAQGKPEECHECTRNLIDALERSLKAQAEKEADRATDDPRNSGLASKVRAYDVWVWNMDDNLFYRETDVDKTDGHVRPPGIPVHSSNYR